MYHEMGLRRRLLERLAPCEQLAMSDDLTGLPNRGAIVNLVESRLARGRPLALLLVDLDHFKELNDTLGHAVGDLLLRKAGRRLSSVLGPDDMIGRLGGDEFAVVLAGPVSADCALAVAQQLRGRLEQPFDLQGVPVLVEASVGVAVSAAGATGVSELLRHADVAMYNAKRERTGVDVYAPERDGHTRDRLTLLGELAAGIPRGELVLVYQPLVSLTDGRLAGAEALVRWHHPVRGLLAPAQFIPAIDLTGVMRALTSHLVAAALTQAAEWRRLGIQVPVSVNLAPADVVDLELPDIVRCLLAEAGARPEDLRLEVTENAVMADLGRALAVLGSLRAIGVGLSVDDFGTGHSSLERLTELPVDELKIDRGFVLRMSGDDRQAAVVEAAVQLSHRLGLRVVAEGVETSETLDRLVALGCDVAQGFLFARPLDADGFAAFAARFADPAAAIAS